LSAKFRENEDQKFKKYAIRRFFRIAPVYYLGIIVYFILSIIISVYDNGNIVIPSIYNFKNILSNLTFTHGFYKPANNNIVPGGWSIGTEMAFYLIFPILFFIANKKINGSLKKIIIWVVVGLILSQITLFFLKLNGINMRNNNFIYFNLINQIPVFFIGIGYYFINPQRNLKYKWTIDLIAFILLTITSIYLWHIVKIDYLFSIIPFISGISFIFLMEVFRKIDFLNHPFLMKIGQVSFSMYVIHFIFAYNITGYISPKFINILNSEVLLIIFYSMSILGAFLLSLLSEKFIEKPFINLGKKIISNLKANVPKTIKK
jgi:peptidoglycan/LPS O-acetylase OafA/YrhL